MNNSKEMLCQFSLVILIKSILIKKRDGTQPDGFITDLDLECEDPFADMDWEKIDFDISYNY